MYKITTTLLLTATSFTFAEDISTLPAKLAAPQEKTEVKTESKVPEYLATDKAVSDKAKKLIIKHDQLINDLMLADNKLKEIITKAQVWQSEINHKKKGNVDALLDKAERLAVSEDLRSQFLSQAHTISNLIKDLDENRTALLKQRTQDAQNHAIEQSKLKILKLLEEKKNLEMQLKLSTPVAKKTKNGEILPEENVQYFTVKKEQSLQSIAWKFYNDNEKWLMIYDYPGNKDKITKKSPSVLIPAGTVLTIPNDSEVE